MGLQADLFHSAHSDVVKTRIGLGLRRVLVCLQNLLLCNYLVVVSSEGMVNTKH